MERRKRVNTHMEEDGHLEVENWKYSETNIIEKGISTLLIEPLFKQAIKKYFSDIKIDLILYSTPPITFANVVRYVKARWGKILFDA